MFTLNGLKREEPIASNSMILHELYFENGGAPSAPGARLAAVLARDFGGQGFDDSKRPSALQKAVG